MPAIYMYGVSILITHHQKEEDGHMDGPNKGHVQMENYWCQMNGKAGLTVIWQIDCFRMFQARSAM